MVKFEAMERKQQWGVITEHSVSIVDVLQHKGYQDMPVRGWFLAGIPGHASWDGLRTAASLYIYCHKIYYLEWFTYSCVTMFASGVPMYAHLQTARGRTLRRSVI